MKQDKRILDGVLTLKVNLDKIDLEQTVKGKLGRWCDMVLIETPDRRFGNDFMIVQDLGKESRGAGERGNILGNGVVFKARAKNQERELEPS